MFGLGLRVPDGSCHSDGSMGGGIGEWKGSLRVGGSELTVSVGHLG